MSGEFKNDLENNLYIVTNDEMNIKITMDALYCYPALHGISINGEKYKQMNGADICQLLIDKNLPLGHFQRYVDFINKRKQKQKN